jgi:hypothetical protein
MKIRTHWTPTYKIPRLVSCNALLGHTAANARVRYTGVRFVVCGQHGVDLMMPAPECGDKMPGQHSRRSAHRWALEERLYPPICRAPSRRDPCANVDVDGAEPDAPGNEPRDLCARIACVGWDAGRIGPLPFGR